MRGKTDGDFGDAFVLHRTTSARKHSIFGSSSISVQLLTKSVWPPRSFLPCGRARRQGDVNTTIAALALVGCGIDRAIRRELRTRLGCALPLRDSLL
jgi:hypothetical protein